MRRLIGPLLATRNCTQVEIAHLLRLHPRTLHRRLADENTKFATLLAEVRAHQAERLLAQAKVPIARIAEMLGYSEQAAFTLGCKRWFGESPSAKRRRLLAVALRGQ